MIAVYDVIAIRLKSGIGRTTEPVAMMMFLVSRTCFFLRHRSLQLCPAASLPVPLKTVTLFFFIKYSMPFEFFSTTLSFFFCTSAKAN